MTKFVLTAAFALGLAAPALAETPLNFTWEGHKIVGSVSQENGAQIIKGEDVTTGRQFVLRVKDGYVRGAVGETEVSYPVPRKRTLTLASAD